MSDIVKTLRAAAKHPANGHGPQKWLNEAADEIERLRADWETARDAHDRRTAEVVRLRAALREIADFNVPRPVGHTFRADGAPSKHDKCLHGETMYDECAACMAVHARAALGGGDD